MDDRAVAGPKARRGRRRLTVDERRDELIQAALDLFSRRPPEEISIDDVAEAAGASRALVYHYFGGKQELYLAAMRSAAGQLSELLDLPNGGTPMQRLKLSLQRYFDFVEDHETGYLAMLRGGAAAASDELSQILDSTRAILLDRILRELKIECPGPVLRVTLRSWMAAVETAGLDWLQYRDLPRQELEALLVEQNIVLLNSAAQHDPELLRVLERLAAVAEETPEPGSGHG